MLISKEGLCGGTYLKKHEECSWSNSDMNKFLNNTLYSELFNSLESQLIIPNPDDNSLLSLLSVSEAFDLFANDKARELTITEAAIKDGKTNYNTLSKVNNWDMKGYRTSWWWLRGEETPSITAPYVTIDGEIIENEKYVYMYTGAIRPVVWVQLPSQ